MCRWKNQRQFLNVASFRGIQMRERQSEHSPTLICSNRPSKIDGFLLVSFVLLPSGPWSCVPQNRPQLPSERCSDLEASMGLSSCRGPHRSGPGCAARPRAGKECWPDGATFQGQYKAGYKHGPRLRHVAQIFSEMNQWR